MRIHLAQQAYRDLLVKVAGKKQQLSVLPKDTDVLLGVMPIHSRGSQFLQNDARS